MASFLSHQLFEIIILQFKPISDGVFVLLLVSAYLPKICSQKEIRKEMERKKNGEKENETKRDREDIKRKKERYKILEQDN